MPISGFLVLTSGVRLRSIKAICGALLSERSAVMNVDLPVSRVLGREDAEQLLKVLLANRRLQALTVYSGLPSTEASMGDATTWLLRQLLRNHPTLIELTVRGYPWRRLVTCFSASLAVHCVTVAGLMVPTPAVTCRM